MLFLQSRDIGGDAIEFVVSHLDVFSFPGGSHHFVHGFGVEQEAALVAIACERKEIIQVYQIDGGVDLNRIEAELSQNIVKRIQNCGQAINAPALRELLSIKRVNRNLQLVEFDASLRIF